MNKKHFFIQILIVVSALVMMVAPVEAAGGITATLTPTQTELAVGDPVELTLAVTHPVDMQVIVPPLEKTWGPYEVWGQSQATTVDNGDGTATTQQTITVTLFDLGTFETPALPLIVSDGSGPVTSCKAGFLPIPLKLSIGMEQNRTTEVYSRLVDHFCSTVLEFLLNFNISYNLKLL